MRGRAMFRGMNRGPERPFQPHEGPAPEYMAAIEAANRKEMEEVGSEAQPLTTVS